MMVALLAYACARLDANRLNSGGARTALPVVMTEIVDKSVLSGAQALPRVSSAFGLSCMRVMLQCVLRVPVDCGYILPGRNDLAPAEHLHGNVQRWLLHLS